MDQAPQPKPFKSKPRWARPAKGEQYRLGVDCVSCAIEPIVERVGCEQCSCKCHKSDTRVRLCGFGCKRPVVVRVANYWQQFFSCDQDDCIQRRVEWIRQNTRGFRGVR